MLDPDERPAGTSEDRDVPVFDATASTLKIGLGREDDDTHNVRLVCAVNGLANGYPNYVNWGRVRTVEAWTDKDRDSSRTAVLQSLGAGSFQDYQRVRLPTGSARTIHIRIVDAYVGQQMTSVDPDICKTRKEVGAGIKNDPVGCNPNPTPKAGLAEVVVYERDRTWWSALRGRYL